MNEITLPPETKPKKVNKLVLAALIIIGLGIGLMLYWSLADRDVLAVNNAPVPVSKTSPTPERDGQVVFRIDFCKHSSAEGRVRTSFVTNAREVFIPVYTDNLEAGCRIVDVPVIIPKELDAGKYHVHYRITYQVNPIKEVIEEFDSQEFDIQ